jgi:hypothetical protein
MSAREALDKAQAALDELTSLDPDTLTDDDLDDVIFTTIRLAHRCHAAARRVAPRWEQRAVWARGRFRNATGRLARTANVSRREAGRVLTQGHQLLDMPAAAAALAAGELSVDHIDRLAACRARRRGDHYRRDEADLVTVATSQRFEEMVATLGYWRNRVDAEVGDDGDRPSAGRHFEHKPGVFGEHRFGGDLDPVGGAEVATALERIAAELAAHDRSQPGRVTRSRAQLRADALVEMARRSMSMAPGARKPRPLVTVVVGQAEFARLCELSSGVVVGAGDLIGHLEALDIETMIFDGRFTAISCSTQREFTGMLRRAIEVRDRRCQHPDGCDEPIDRCDVDHVVPRHLGGPTSQANGRLLCRFHNRVEPAYCTPPATKLLLLDQRSDDPTALPNSPPNDTGRDLNRGRGRGIGAPRPSPSSRA